MQFSLHLSSVWLVSKCPKTKRTGLQLCRGRKGWWCFSRYLQAVYPLFYFSVFLSLLFSFLYLFPSVYLFIYLFIYWSGKISGSVVWSLWTWREERFVSAALQLRTKLSVLRNPWSFLPLSFWSSVRIVFSSSFFFFCYHWVFQRGSNSFFFLLSRSFWRPLLFRGCATEKTQASSIFEIVTVVK